MSSDFFFLHSVEEGEGEGENRESCCTLGVQEFVCHGVSVLAMGLSCDICSCDEVRLSGRTTNELAFV